MQTVTAKNAIRSAENIRKYLVDASDLQLPPSLFPPTLETTLGNRLPLVFIRYDEHADAAIYEQEMQDKNGVTVMVFND